VGVYTLTCDDGVVLLGDWDWGLEFGVQVCT
jgi:hypothetical protein